MQCLVVLTLEFYGELFIKTGKRGLTSVKFNPSTPRLSYTPYSKVAENTLFFCLHVNWPLLPHSKPNIPLNSADGIEATRAN